MPFGRRRFTQLVYAEKTENGTRVSFYRARFVPLDLDAGDELIECEDLTRAIDDNAMAKHPLPDLEEQLALKAFAAQARGKTFSRAAVESVAERGRQRVVADVLEPGERATIERFRRMVLGLSMPERKSDPDIGADTMRSALLLLDRYLPKGT